MQTGESRGGKKNKIIPRPTPRSALWAFMCFTSFLFLCIFNGWDDITCNMISSAFPELLEILHTDHCTAGSQLPPNFALTDKNTKHLCAWSPAQISDAPVECEASEQVREYGYPQTPGASQWPLVWVAADVGPRLAEWPVTSPRWTWRRRTLPGPSVSNGEISSLAVKRTQWPSEREIQPEVWPKGVQLGSVFWMIFVTESSRIRGSKANRGDSFLEGLSRVAWPMTVQPSHPSPADSPPGMNSTQLSTSWVCSHHPTGHRQEAPRRRRRKLASGEQELGCPAGGGASHARSPISLQSSENLPHRTGLPSPCRKGGWRTDRPVWATSPRPCGRGRHFPIFVRKLFVFSNKTLFKRFKIKYEETKKHAYIIEDIKYHETAV